MRPGFLAALLLSWFWGQAVSVSPDVGLTADEAMHVTGGYSYWKFNDYRLQPENGNLPQRIAGLPALGLAASWVPDPPSAWEAADGRRLSYAFFFLAGNRPDLLVFAARALAALVGVGAGWLVYRWSSSLFGPAGGILAAACYSCNPTLLAHAALATSDMAAAFGFLAATLAGWRLLHRLSPGRIVFFGLACGILALAKYSAPVFVLIFIPLVVLRLARRAPLPFAFGRWRGRLRGWTRLAAIGGASLGSVILAAATIWAAYGFRYQATPKAGPTRFPLAWDALLATTPYYLGAPTLPGQVDEHALLMQPTAVHRGLAWARNHRLLPEAYLYGFANVYNYAKWRPAFFAGEYRTSGWRTFFPVLFAAKNPLPLLGLYATALWSMLRYARVGRDARRRFYRVAPVVVLVAVYATFAVGSSLNIGYRHLLLVDAALCLLAGAPALLFPLERSWFRGLVCVLLLGTAAVSWAARPWYLAYFNGFVGGSDGAYRCFVDSSLDWGQGLPRLHRWLEQEGRRGPVYLAYFGSDSPRYEGLRAIRLGDEFFDLEPRARILDLTPGIYVISATLFQGVYTLAPGPWTRGDERAYQTLWRQMHDPSAGPPSAGTWLEWDQARFGRLRHYLRARSPDAQPDPSLLVYRLDAADLAAALAPDRAVP